MPRLTIFLISFGLSGLTGWATGWGLQMGYWLVTEAKFVTNQTNYITGRQLIEDKSPRKALKLATALPQVRGFASNLYLAISQGWRAGCHSQHEAKLFLEDRVDTGTGTEVAR